MIGKVINRLAHIVCGSRIVRGFYNRRHFPGAAIHHTVNLVVKGRFSANEAIISRWSQIIVPLGASLLLGEGSYVGSNVEIGPIRKIRIGSYTSIQDRCIIIGDVQIGDYCVLAPNIYISSGNHHFDDEPWSLIRDQDERARACLDAKNMDEGQIIIEDDCWVGINAVVLRGVKIGKGAVIGANAVVTKDVAPYSVVAGVPAVELRKRLHFCPPREIRWDVDEHMPYFYSGFKLSRDQRESRTLLGGLVIKQSVFCLALDADVGDQLGLIVKMTGGNQDAYIRSGDVCATVPADFCELMFRVLHNKNFHVFEVSGISFSNDEFLVLQSARRI